MRKGQNISKEQIIKLDDCQHRVIIPLFIPNEENYYKEAFKIFQICLFSVIKTALSPLKISVVSNGSCESVNTKLQAILNEGYINELIIETENIGKLNSILKALRTLEERLITVTDGDVLFLNDCEQEVLNIFKTFPKAGMISPVPVFRTHLRLTSNICKRYIFSKKLQFRPVKNQEAITRFANSIGWSRLDLKFKDVIATLKAKNNTIAVLGNSHFVGTYKREVFNSLPKDGSKYKLGGDSEYVYLDSPVVKYRVYRQATYNNYAYHIGNTLEGWVEEAFSNLKEEQKNYNTLKELKVLKNYL